MSVEDRKFQTCCRMDFSSGEVEIITLAKTASLSICFELFVFERCYKQVAVLLCGLLVY